jgi:YegS/Rv2252/BmrU family lipid kinase
VAILSTRKILLIANPASKRGGRLRGAVEAMLRDEVPDLEVALTTGAGDATRLASSARETHHTVMVAGGDGTVAEVVSGLAGSGVPIGVIPCGTGNLVARALGIPLQPKRAVAVALGGRIRRVDVGRFDDGECLIFTAGAGIDASMVASASSTMKRRFGVSAYFVTAARAIFRHSQFRVRATVDGQELECSAWAVFVANFGNVLGGLIHLGPHVAADDGMLDLCVYSPNTIGDAFEVAWRMFRNDFRPHRCMRFLRGSTIELFTDPVRVFQSDGELRGSTPFRVRVEPGAATFLVPHSR